MMKRDPLPAVYASTAEIKVVSKGMVGRSELVIKHKSVAELMHYTRGDEG
jgi:hypothetical protein